MYDNVHDATRYLGGTVCMWDDTPLYVGECTLDAEGRIVARTMAVQDVGIRDRWDHHLISDPRFNAMKFKLGYMNRTNGNVAYISRRPARIQSQGLSSGSLALKLPDQAKVSMGRNSLSTLMRDPGFTAMLRGQYPTVAEARVKLMAQPEVTAVAFDANMALRRHEAFRNLFFLCYKGEDVAFSDDSNFNLPDEYRYLAETCQEKGCLRAA